MTKRPSTSTPEDRRPLAERIVPARRPWRSALGDPLDCETPGEWRSWWRARLRARDQEATHE